MKWPHPMTAKSPIWLKLNYVVHMGQKRKLGEIFFFWPLRGPTGATKFRDFGKFALDKDTLNGCNFFVFEDN